MDKKKRLGKTRVATKQHDSMIIDKDTSEILHTITNTETKLTTEPDYYKVYIHDIAILYKLNQTEQAVINNLASNMSFNNMVFLVMPIKQIMMEQLKMPLNTLNKAIDNLYKKGLIIRKAKSLYIVNPYYIAKGKWADIENLRIQIDYSSEGRNLKVMPKFKEIEVAEAQRKLYLDAQKPLFEDFEDIQE